MEMTSFFDHAQQTLLTLFGVRRSAGFGVVRQEMSACAANLSAAICSLRAICS